MSIPNLSKLDRRRRNYLLNVRSAIALPVIISVFMLTKLNPIALVCIPSISAMSRLGNKADGARLPDFQKRSNCIGRCSQAGWGNKVQ
jgi:hypothetical protein